MKTIYASICTALIVSVASMPVALPAAEAGQQEQATQAPVYKPPLRGSPSGRIGGGTRGTEAAVELAVLAPDHTGLTTKRHPTLYWYVSKPVQARLEVTVINAAGIEPLLETTVNSSGRSGIQRLDLAEQGIALEPNTEYRWYVAVVPDAEHRSNDILASGTIQRREAPARLKARLHNAAPEAAYSAYAAEGYWYDAVDVLSRLIEQHPERQDLHQHRAALLEQVGLDRVASYCRQQRAAVN